jgi:hypothetical protein
MKDFEKIPCFIKSIGNSNVDYLLLFTVNSKKNDKSFVFSNYSKSGGFNEMFWLTDIVDKKKVCYVSQNLITFNKKFINDEENLSFVEIPIDNDISDFIQTVFINEISNYLILDLETQEYYILKEDVVKNVNEEGIFISNGFKLTDEINKIINY